MRRLTHYLTPVKHWLLRTFESLNHRLARSFDLLKRWTVLAILALALAIAAGAWLWHFPELRPYLFGFATAMAAFLGPLPGLLSPETRGKWLIVVGVAAVIGLGAWHSAYQLEKERQSLNDQVKRLGGDGERLRLRISLQQEFFRGSVKNLSTNEQSKFLLGAARRLVRLYPQPRVEPLLDVIAVEIDLGNGHAYYFAGEEYRSLRDQTNMRGAFLRYLAAAERHPEATDGDAHACSQRPAGYCGERTALINHLMARDYYHEALSSSGGRQVQSLQTALTHEQKGLEVWNFNRDGSLESSCELLLGIAEHLHAMGQSTNEVDLALMRYLSRYGACG